MLETCPRCGATLSSEPGELCPSCQSPLPGTPSPAASPDDALPNGLRIPPIVLTLVPTAICAWLGSRMTVQGFSLSDPSFEMIAGGILGLVMGVVVLLDNRGLQHRLAVARRDSQSGGDPKSPKPEPTMASTVCAMLLLCIPLVAGVLAWQRESLEWTLPTVHLLGAVALVSTAVLGYFDTRQLALRARDTSANDEQTASMPVLSFLGMLAFWIVGYPAHFVGRTRFGGRNFLVPALLSMGVFLGPSVASWFAEPELPAVDSADVLSIVKTVVDDSLTQQGVRAEMGEITINDPVELSFDPDSQVRTAKATVSWELGEIPLFYTVTWQDRSRGVIYVQLFDQDPNGN